MNKQERDELLVFTFASRCSVVKAPEPPGGRRGVYE